MGLRLKFNLVLFAVFAIGLGVTGYVSYELLHRNARAEVLRNAGVMMEAALSMRAYTVAQVRPNLRVVDDEFLPQGVPAFSAGEIMNLLRKKYPDYAYKEATLNPTNPRDRAVEWEADVVNTFRNVAERKEITGERDTPTGRMMYLARPIQIKDPACLACHSTPAAAPGSMIKLYGENNGFGWKHMEVVGAQVVSVPMSLAVKNANDAFMVFMSSLAAIFVVTFVVLNVMLSFMILRPITRMSAAADQVSQGDFDVPEFGKGKDEISTLGVSFNRMRRSLQKALKLIEK